MVQRVLAVVAAVFVFTLPAVGALADYSTPVVGKQHMVVSAHALASKVGAGILDQGGNAIDAAVATAYALAVVYPCCGNLGGGGFMTIHLAEDGRDLTINFRETAPRAATKDMYLDEAGKVQYSLLKHSYLGVGVPGTVRGLDTALTRYGTMDRGQVMAPAIDLAENGFELTLDDTNILVLGTEIFRAQPNVARIFLKDGAPFRPGDRLVQADLAQTLKRIAENGPDAFYDGPIAAAIVEASAADGGILSLEDFAGYRVSEPDPVRCNYRGYEVLSMAPPSSGGVTICLILNILEGYPLERLGFNSAANAHFMVEAMRRAYVNRNMLLGDPDFVANPIEELLAKSYAARLRQTIGLSKATPIDDIEHDSALGEGAHTTHLSVIDGAGNAVALTTTNNSYFGSGRIAGSTGFFLNDEMADFTAKPGVANMFGLVQGDQNAIEPGKQPLSSMSPTLVKKDGEVFLVLGSPGGGRIITIVVQGIVNVIDFKMNIAEAVNAPRIHNQWLPDTVFHEPRAFTRDTARLLEHKGYELKEQRPWGALEAIMKVPEEGLPHGPKMEGYGDSVHGSFLLPGFLYGANDQRRPRGLAIGR
ncbi:MAG: gamma-glutamyltransferase [Alphaproteobacteria bacterium]|nr:gamma-glutamyltransferase [Alphaproteobacteria bacterium]